MATGVHGSVEASTQWLYLAYMPPNALKSSEIENNSGTAGAKALITHGRNQPTCAPQYYNQKLNKNRNSWGGGSDTCQVGVLESSEIENNLEIGGWGSLDTCQVMACVHARPQVVRVEALTYGSTHPAYMPPMH